MIIGLPVAAQFELPTSSTDPVITLVRHALRGSENELLAAHGQDAQNTLDALHHILDTSSFSIFSEEHSVQPRLRRLLLKLALQCRSVPSQLILRDAQWSSMEGRGGGAFADIYRAKYRGKTVAVKRLRVFQMTDDVAKNDLINSLYHESLLWRHLSHPHILPFLGIADDIFNESLCMIMPWSEHGNVRDVIHNWKENVNSSIQDLFISVHTWLNEIASGLAYLHGEDINIAHGDLRGVNILIDSEYKIRLADFGLAVFAGDSSNHYASVRGGASHWLAPEIIDPEAFGMSSSRPTFAADIYSFACVCIELYTSQAPFSGWNSTTVLLHVLRGGRPARPAFHQTEEMSEQLYALLQRCWDQSWDKRPTAEELSQMLSGMMPLLLGQQGSSLDTENPRPGPDVNLHPRRVRSLNVGDKPIKNTSADVKSEVIDVAELQESPKLVPLPDVTGALKAIGAGVRAFTRDITWIMNGLDEVAKIHPVISVATIAFRIVIDLEMTRRENDTRIQYIYTEMKDMMIVLLQLKDVMELNDLGPDGNTLASKLEPLCRQVAEDVKACANTCDAFLKQYLLPKVLKMEEWYDQLVSYVLIFARKRSELQLAVAIHTARTGDEVASALTSSFISQRIELFSQLLRQHTPSQESLLREAVSFRGGVQAVMNNETDARELLKMQEAIRSDLNRGDLESHVPMTYTDFKEILAQTCNNIVTQNMTVFGVKYDLLLRKLNETPSLPEAERIPSLITGPYDRIKDYNIRSLWKEMGWRMSVKSSHFIHALHDLFQEQKYDEGLLEPASEGWTLDYLEDRWHRSIVEAIDDDRTGFVTIAKLNRFTDACFPGWSLVRWLSYWAIGWSIAAHGYRAKIRDISAKMHTIVPYILPENRKWANSYLDIMWRFIEEMTSGLQDLEVHSKDLATEFQPYISHEEDRMKVNLTIIKYSIDALDTVYAVTGPGNLENHIMTLLYLLLDRDLQLFKAAQIQILHPRELQDAATNILRVNNVVNNRVKDLTVLFNQRDLDLDYHFEVCAYGLFKYIHDYEPLWVFDKRMEVDDFQPLLVLPNYLDERESTAPEALVDVALLRYPTTQERTAFAYLALDASAEDTHRDESLPFHVIRGLWYGFSYTTTMYPTNWMVAYDLDFLSESSDGRAISSTGTHVEHGDYMLTGILSEAPDGAVILKLQVTYESDARTEYLTGQLQPDGSILCSLSWGEDEFYAVPVQCEVILRRVSSDVMRLRPSPWELSQDSTRARALWRFALQSTLHEVRKKNWSWHYFAERRRRRKRTVDLMMAASSVSLVNRPTDEELAACRQSVNTSDALLYKSLADYFKLVGPNHSLIASCDECGSRLDQHRFLCLDCVSPQLTIWQTYDTCSQACFSRSRERGQNAPHDASHDMLKLRSAPHASDLPMVIQKASRAARWIKPNDDRKEETAQFQHSCNACTQVVSLPAWYCVSCDCFICDDCEENDVLSCVACGESYTPLMLEKYAPDHTFNFICSTCSCNDISPYEHDTSRQHMLSHSLLRFKPGLRQEPASQISQPVVAILPTLESKVANMDNRLIELTERFTKMERMMKDMMRVLMARLPDVS